MTFIKGKSPWNKGKSNLYSAETLCKMSLAKKGKVSAFKGKTHTDEAKAVIREKRKLQTNGGSKKGCVSPFKGKQHSQAVVDGMRERAKHQKHVGPKGPWSDARRKAQKIIVSPSKVMLNKKEYHPAWREIRKVIYKRDMWTCSICHSKCSRVKGIACHHIDYDVDNNDPSNLITLCSSCHAKTNFDRLDWMRFLKTKLH